MGAALIDPSFASGEISPSLYGRVDVAKVKSSATTMRNMFVRYTGGSYSRAGSAFVGYSKQTGRQFRPRLVRFQFNNDQGLALEFGNFYMRVIFQGAQVVDSSLSITAITQANPAVITAPATGGLTATPLNAGVTRGYGVGELVTLAGGTFSIPAQIRVDSTKLLQLQSQYGFGSGYVPADDITLSGGIFSIAAHVTVSTTTVNSISVSNAGTGGTPGTQTITGTTGTGTKFQASVTVDGTGKISGVNGVTVGGNYSVNPTTISSEPVTGGGLTGAIVAVSMQPNTLAVATAGTFSSDPPSGLMFQSATSGSGTGAQFNLALMGALAVSFSNPGSYSVFPANPVSQAFTNRNGQGLQFTITNGSVSAYNVGDWIFIENVGGMVQMNGRTAVISGVSGNNYSLQDVFSNNIDSTSFIAYTSGGTISRIFTLVTPWAEEDLSYLKFDESTDTVSICCVNAVSQVEYPTYDLVRNSDSSWALTQVQMSQSIAPPPTIALAVTGAPSGGTAFAHYQYVATAVSPIDGTESVASPIGDLPSGVDIAAYAGTVTITVGVSPGAVQYNFYKAQPGYSTGSTNIPAPPVGAQFGYVGFSLGPQFIDQNVIVDFTQLPPNHSDPFARGVIVGATPISSGSNITTATATITTSTGTGAVVQCVIQGGQVVGYVASEQGRNYDPSDTITITVNAGGVAPTASLNVGPQSGTYPSVVSYYQQRRVYAATLNNPDTYYMSQEGAYTNFDFRIPSIDTDAITGTPWAQQVNGIQFLIAMPGGLVVLTGLGAWQLTGAGGSSFNPQAITAATQVAQPQSFNGCSSTVPPIKINFDIIYLQSKGARYRDLSYQFFTNIYTGEDITIHSSHLFDNYTIIDHAWSEEPYKTLWSVRSDGVMLALAYLKDQQILGWSRHDTQGQYVTVCSVVEPPVDAIYMAVQRNLTEGPAYLLERFDDRMWTVTEDCWCVDAGLSLAHTFPNATLSFSAANGVGSISGITALVGGSNYSAGTTATVVDNNGIGPGSGATVALTIGGGGAITGIAFPTAGTFYTYPALVIYDPAGTGVGGSATLTLNTTGTATASSAIFAPGDVGDVIRAGGGLAVVTAYSNTTNVTVNFLRPFVAIQPDSGGALRAVPPGSWTMDTPTATVHGLYHLAGMTVTGLADGIVIPPTVVPSNGTLTLPGGPATSVIIGLGFQAQFQNFYVDVGEPTVQGQRKKVAQVTVRAELSLGMKVGTDQLDASTTSPPQIAAVWNNLDAVPDLSISPYNDPGYLDLWTGDVRLPVGSTWGKKGQIAFQQDNPLPMQILAVIPEVLPGDDPDIKPKPRGK